MKFFGITAILMFPLMLFAQQPKSEKEQEKLFYESIEKQIERYTEQFNLDDWQVFYVDSIITTNSLGLRDEIMALSASKVSNSDIYVAAQDKWGEATFVALQKVFDEEQWAKFLKQGGARDKKARDKRAAKRQ